MAYGTTRAASVRPEALEGRTTVARSWFDKLTTNGLCTQIRKLLFFLEMRLSWESLDDGLLRIRVSGDKPP